MLLGRRRRQNERDRIHRLRRFPAGDAVLPAGQVQVRPFRAQAQAGFVLHAHAPGFTRLRGLQLQGGAIHLVAQLQRDRQQGWHRSFMPPPRERCVGARMRQYTQAERLRVRPQRHAQQHQAQQGTQPRSCHSVHPLHPCSPQEAEAGSDGSAMRGDVGRHAVPEHHRARRHRLHESVTRPRLSSGRTLRATRRGTP